MPIRVEFGSLGSVRATFSKKIPAGGLTCCFRIISPAAAARPASTSSRRALVVMVSTWGAVSRRNAGRVLAHSIDWKRLGTTA